MDLDGYRLGKTMGYYRALHAGTKSGGLTDDRRQALEERGMVWRVNTARDLTADEAEALLCIPAASQGEIDWSLVGVDSTSCRPHQHGAGGPGPRRAAACRSPLMPFGDRKDTPRPHIAIRIPVSRHPPDPLATTGNYMHRSIASAAAAVVLAAALVACGGSDGDSSKTAATKSAGSSGAATSGGQQTPDAAPSSTTPSGAKVGDTLLEGMPGMGAMGHVQVRFWTVAREVTRLLATGSRQIWCCRYAMTVG
ncbi:hypothetical protein SAZ11_05325 [Streptomyces sp. FXJ1.4098]|nr:hypothetical protein [Streptomyces sp. FXJ1.4098]